ncbi:stressosome-associated protein Prli42 [Caldibacillus thermolactis]|uniref:Stressosome-associated protein Prli42 n=1 Tax=Pallidibacillus thermolactis TaxID=251051 RepID=A0ABT2WEM8_9BACI|nr:stressosome-associated protein Prli42 [Pallidibacillus thermolactis]MCU9594115.1 stressosome-associated protein Prli42 [Pallidibacillus thermolactis]MCU9600294.1 stressosome-associated protein Prli42 [Pallidibacillus thermolactis subsp. kokeshiiformis]MED1672614.1 stressosome-associated protein Prli42 [Pallidibacillus thermolactis subsp. kokeshiiformis]
MSNKRIRKLIVYLMIFAMVATTILTGISMFL